MNARRLMLTLAGTVAVSAATSPAAVATTFCVGGPAGCSGVPVAAANLETGALAAPQLADGQPDQIVIAPGTYTEVADGTWNVGAGNDALTIRGAGAGQTTLGSAGTGNQMVLNLDAAGDHPVTLRDLTVAVPASFPDMGGYGAAMAAVGDVVEHVHVTSANPRASGISTDESTTLRDIEVDTPAGTAVLVSAGSATLVENAVLAGTQGVESYPGATTTVRRARIAVTGDSVGGAAAGLSNQTGSLTASDVLITLTGAAMNQAAGVTASAVATDSTTSLSHLTIAKAGGTNTVGVSSSVNSGNPGNASVTLSNSIVRGVDFPGSASSVAGGGVPAITVRTSNAPPLLSSGDGTVNQSEGNQDADPQFVAPASGDYRLGAGSPSIDAGNGAYTTQATDLDGVGRVQDGNEDGLAKPDQGAYERPDPTPPVPVAPSSPSSPKSPGSPALPSGPSKGAKKTCKVPRLKGLSKKRAKRRLRKGGCRLGKVRRPHARSKRKLVVRRQSLKPGKVVPRGTKVKLRLGVRPKRRVSA
jgi:PASTA domain